MLPSIGILPSEEEALATDEPTLGLDSSPELRGGYVEFILLIL
jgi:hypothetical protein